MRSYENHEDEDSMRTWKLLSSVLEDEDMRPRIPCLVLAPLFFSVHVTHFWHPLPLGQKTPLRFVKNSLTTWLLGEMCKGGSNFPAWTVTILNVAL